MREDQHVLNRTGELLLGFVNLSTVWRTSENYTLSRDNNKLLKLFLCCTLCWHMGMSYQYY